MKRVIRGIGKVLHAVVCFSVMCLFLRFLWYFPSYYGHVDLSQSYRKIDGYENIIFISRDDCYRRTFWGLKKVDKDVSALKDEQTPTNEEYTTLKAIVGDDYYIREYVYSPDCTKILYEEVHPWGEGAPTDDADNYYKVVDLSDGTIVTLFKGPQQCFDIYWE